MTGLHHILFEFLFPRWLEIDVFVRSEGIIVSENEVVVVVRKHRRDALCVVIWTHRTSVAVTARVPPVHAETFPSLNL